MRTTARYDEQHKAATRSRILDTAGRRLKTDGIDGSGVATLMKDAGLTNGAFYAHFASKDDLVGEVVATQLHDQLTALEDLPPGAEGVEQLVRRYLSAEHRDHPADGCPSAALLDEIARGSETTRRAYTDGLLAVVDAMAARLHPGAPGSERGRLLGVWASMVGTLQLARSLTDPALADEVLEVGLHQALTLLGRDAEGDRA